MVEISQQRSRDSADVQSSLPVDEMTRLFSEPPDFKQDVTKSSKNLSADVQSSLPVDEMTRIFSKPPDFKLDVTKSSENLSADVQSSLPVDEVTRIFSEPPDFKLDVTKSSENLSADVQSSLRVDEMTRIFSELPDFKLDVTKSSENLSAVEKRIPVVTRAFSEEVGEHFGPTQTRDETPSTGELSRALSWPLLKTPEDVQSPKLEVRPPRRFVQVRGAGGRLWQHYYPEGGWGWIVVTCAALVHALGHGLQLSFAVLVAPLVLKFAPHHLTDTSWLGALSAATALLLSPVTIAFCRRKSTRVTAVLGGLVAALGCLFTSFATQFHQLFFSYALVLGVGVGMTRDTSTLMVAQYFKRRRELVEIFIVAGSGLGLALMSAFIRGAVRAVGWRLGLQAVTCAVFLTFFLGTFYRSASLYHPQRRAILHLKNQKRKVKDKSKPDDKPPFFDVSTLRSKTVRILLASTALTATGLSTPIFFLAHQAELEGLGASSLELQTCLGLAWALGCAALGLLVVRNSADCRIARQYLCQACAFVSGLAILALTAVQGYRGYLLFVWVYGTFCGGYHYSLKMFTYERVRARNFARTWGFVQCSQALPIALGVPLSGYISEGCGGKAGYYFSSTCVLLGSAALSLIDVHRRRVARHKHTAADGATHTCRVENCPDRRGRRLSFTDEEANGHAALTTSGGAPATAAAAAAAALLGQRALANMGGSGELKKPELTCISEEGIADMDLPDNLLDDLDYIGDCITSCNKVENYLMLSEFENNLIAETPVITDRKGRRWSLQRNPVPRNFAPLVPPAADLEAPGAASLPERSVPLERRRSREVPPFRNPSWRLQLMTSTRPITIIDEVSIQ